VEELKAAKEAQKDLYEQKIKQKMANADELIGAAQKEMHALRNKELSMQQKLVELIQTKKQINEKYNLLEQKLERSEENTEQHIKQINKLKTREKELEKSESELN
jgi:hypothetical protein